MIFHNFLLKHRLVCPFCLRKVRWHRSLVTCPNEGCGQELPVQYVDQDMLMPHFPVQVFGWAQHGKSAYLSALTMMLMKMNKVWPRFAWSAATEASQRKVQDVNIYMRQGAMPPSTPLGSNECYVMMLREMEPWSGRALLIRDCPGEVFDGTIIDLEKAPFLLRSKTVFMFASLPDLAGSGAPRPGGHEGRTMDMLMNNYITTLTRNGVRLRRQRRRVVVVLTKADLIRNLPSELRSYLIDDVLWSAVTSVSPMEVIRQFQPASHNLPGIPFMQHYLDAMHRMSNAVRKWLEQESPELNFVRLAEQYNIELRFSITSSTGAQVPMSGAMTAGWEPRRVLDPLFWGLELDRMGSWQARWAALSERVFSPRGRSGPAAPVGALPPGS